MDEMSESYRDEKLAELCRISRGITGTGAPLDIIKFRTRMEQSGSLEDFIHVFFDSHSYLLKTRIHQFRLQNILYTIAAPFSEGRGTGIIPVFMTNTDRADYWTRLGFFYMSRSQTMWRLLPLTIWGWYEKGEQGQHSLNAPWELQIALDAAYTAVKRKFDERGLSFPRISAGMFTMHGEVREEVAQTVAVNVAHTSIIAPNGADKEPACKGINSAVSTAGNINRKKKPQVNENALVSEGVNWPVYGTIKRAVMYSKDKSLRYVFCLTEEGIFLGGIELERSKLSNYGIRAEYVVDFPTLLLTPIFEYPSEVPEGAGRDWNKARNGYVKITGFHERMIPRLFADQRDYCLLKNKAAELSGTNDVNDARQKMREVDRRLRAGGTDAGSGGKSSRLVR